MNEIKDFDLAAVTDMRVRMGLLREYGDVFMRACKQAGMCRAEAVAWTGLMYEQTDAHPALVAFMQQHVRRRWRWVRK